MHFNSYNFISQTKHISSEKSERYMLTELIESDMTLKKRKKRD